ncbi:MAG TPA: sigma-70 family RNA polymerase sigma factor [Planctomycetaceae bacterium]|nr:sigma-70 family RNA polymerase sigma factor [Planctomycetaceae bacterium]
MTSNCGSGWPESQQTQELLRHAGAGDGEAVNRLLERHRESLRRMVQLRLDRALGARVDASDIVQDVLWEASRRLSDYLRDAKVPFHLWLRELAKDHLIDAHRRHRKAQRRSVDRERSLAPEFAERSSLDLAAQLRDNELTPAAATIQKELELRFLSALDQLDDEDAEIVLMRHHEQLTNSEAAQALGLSPAAAGMRHLRALRRLRVILGERPSTG